MISAWSVTAVRTEHVEPASAQGSESLPDGSDSKFTIGQHVGLSYHEVLHQYPGYHPWGKEQKSPEEIKKNPSIRFSIAGCLFVPGIVHSP